MMTSAHISLTDDVTLQMKAADPPGKGEGGGGRKKRESVKFRTVTLCLEFQPLPCNMLILAKTVRLSYAWKKWTFCTSKTS